MIRLVSFIICTFLICTFLVLTSVSVRADAVTELKQNLQNLSGERPIAGSLQIAYWNKRGKGTDARIVEGNAQLELKEDAHGVQLGYSNALMKQMDLEEQAALADPNTPQPTSKAVGRLSVRDIQHILSAKEHLLRQLDQATFIREETAVYKGQNTRKLIFELDEAMLSKEEKEYVKDFEASLSLWLNDANIPVASETSLLFKGRAFLVFSFESQEQNTVEYAVINGRLIMVKQERLQIGDSTAGPSESRTLTILQLPSR